MNTHGTCTPDGSDADAALDAMPEHLGGVRLGRLLGEGGMGRVYLGHHLTLDVAVAVKVMRNRGHDRSRFLTEARLAARVQHPNVVRILHAGDEGGQRFLVLEYVPGRTLKQVIAERGALPWREAADYLLQAARGLAAAHRLGIIHRDIKPSNLLCDGEGRVKVSDLGVARTVIGSDPSTLDRDSGAVVGSPGYMAPEQTFNPHLVTPAADVYGLGVTFHVLLTATAPFPDRSSGRRFTSLRRDAAPDPGLLVPDLPRPLRNLVRRMLATDPAGRPNDGAAVVVELERLLGLATDSTTCARPPPSRHERRLWWIATAAGVAAVSTLLLGWAHGRDEAPPSAVAPAPAELPAPPVAAAPGLAATPPRAVFVLAGALPAAAQAGLAAACSASGLPVVERARIDALVAEQKLLGEGRLDPGGAIRVGRLLGGHLALFAQPVEDAIDLRCVLVETGEVVASRLVAPAEVGAAATAQLAAAAALLPLRAAVERLPTAVVVHAGARHGLHLGDRLVLRRGLAEAEVATATVGAVEANRATLAGLPADADLSGLSALRP